MFRLAVRFVLLLWKVYCWGTLRYSGSMTFSLCSIQDLLGLARFGRGRHTWFMIAVNIKVWPIIVVFSITTLSFLCSRSVYFFEHLGSSARKRLALHSKNRIILFLKLVWFNPYEYQEFVATRGPTLNLWLRGVLPWRLGISNTASARSTECATQYCVHW